MADTKEDYITALRFRWLTRFYDPIAAATTREKTFKRRLLEQAELAATQRVLDLGCGTGTLAIWAKQVCPNAHVTGLDGDPQVLAHAREKAEGSEVQIQLDQGLHVGGTLPNLMAQVGLAQVTTRSHVDTMFGSLGLYSACKQGEVNRAAKTDT